MKSFLVIQTAFTGDVILATPIIEAIHAAYPNAKIDFLLRKGNEGLFDGHPFINEVIVWDKKTGKYLNLWRILKRIRKTHYDAVINCQRFANSGLITGLSGSAMRIGFDKNPFSFLFTHRVHHQIGDHRHECERNLTLLEPLSLKGNAVPKLYPPLSTVFIEKPYVTVSPASVWFTKQWPEEKWITFLKQIPPQFGIVLLGGPSDANLCDRILQKAGVMRAQHLCGKVGLLASAAIIRDAAMNYVNDSAPMHLASAVNAPVTAIYCSTVPAFGFGPLSDQRFVVETDESLACRPCGLHGKKTCPEGHFKCGFTIQEQRLLSVLPKAS